MMAIIVINIGELKIQIKIKAIAQQRFCSILQGLVFFYFGCFLFKNLSIFVKAWCLISKTKQSRKTLCETVENPQLNHIYVLKKYKRRERNGRC